MPLRSPPALLALLLLAAAPAPAFASAIAAERAFEEGARLLAEGKTAGAEAAFKRAVGLDPTHAKAWSQLGNIHISAGALEPAVEAFGRALKVEPGESVARYNLAYALRRLARFPAAAEQYRLYLQQVPDDADALYGLAESLRSAGEIAAAAEAYERYAGAEKRSGQEKWIAKAKQQAAELRARAAAPSEAAPAPEVAAPAPPAQAGRGAVAAKAPKAPKAERSGADAGSNLHLSLSAGGAKPPPSAAPEAAPMETETRAVAAPTRPEAFRAALVNLQAGDYAAAETRLAAAAQASPNDGLILAAQASAALGLGDGARAEERYRRALVSATGDTRPALLLGLAEALRLQDRIDEARSTLEQLKATVGTSAALERLAEERLAALADARS